MQEDFEMPLNEAEQFRRIWQRVQGAPKPGDFLAPDGTEQRPLPPAPPVPARPTQGETEGFLRSAIDETVCRARELSRWPQLQGLARRSEEQRKRLAAALFLLTGVRCRPRPHCPPGANSLTAAARSLYHRFRTAERAYQQAAQRTEEPSLRTLFHELAGECVICREQLRRLVEQML